MYEGIARGRKRITSKKCFPLKLFVETNHAGIIPKKREKKTVKKIRYNVFKEYTSRRFFHK
tara:strand:- start:328 stop:510 length:183 start_codon:yes stop_codon:yes gene_type:complete